MKHSGPFSVNGVRIGAAVKEKAHRCEMSAANGNMEGCCPSSRSDPTSADRLRILIAAYRPGGHISSAYVGGSGVTMGDCLWFGTSMAITTKVRRGIDYKATSGEILKSFIAVETLTFAWACLEYCVHGKRGEPQLLLLIHWCRRRCQIHVAVFVDMRREYHIGKEILC